MLLLGLQVFVLAVLSATGSFACAPIPPSEAIDSETNRDVLEAVWHRFHPALLSYLQDIPIRKDEHTRTALAHTSQYVHFSYDFAYIAVSVDWDSTAKESRHWETLRARGSDPDTPVFSDIFKRELLIHEYLHMIQVDEQLDLLTFIESFEQWYGDTSFGTPEPQSNRLKYLLWWNLFRKEGETTPGPHWQEMEYQGQYAKSSRGVEEFAYIGSNLLLSDLKQDRRARLQELSPDLLATYANILNPEFLAPEY